MLVFFKQNLALLSVPKTGTTSYEMALRPQADIVFTKNVKHMTIGKFHRRLTPFLQATYDVTPERMAVIRDPIDSIRSWYKYRSPERLGEHPYCHGGISFDDFVLDVISVSPSKAAGIGSQASFLSLANGSVPVHHLFAYDRQMLIREFLEDRFAREITLKPKNVSPDIPAPISPEVETELRAARPADFALYERVVAADGVLREYCTP